jgi:protein-L-isoaspartate(D-aspartate) O-methyltransferase
MALQGFAVDGRKVARLRISFAVQGRDIRQGQDARQWPHVMVTFYDDQRAELAHEVVGPFRGTFDWRREEKSLTVPPRAREAILRVGLLGAIGELDLDDLAVTP